MAAGFEGKFPVAAREGVDAFDKGFQGPGDGVRDQEDEHGAGNDGHETQAKEQTIKALEIGVRFTVGLENDDVRDGLKARGEFNGASVITLVAEN